MPVIPTNYLNYLIRLRAMRLDELAPNLSPITPTKKLALEDLDERFRFIVLNQR